jgi:hypothetical protein
MTAIHWAALKGHEQVAEMLLDVGAVQLLHVPDAAGDTPVALAMRKKNRYLVLCFLKCQLFQALFGRPHISHNNFANLFLIFSIVNILVFAFVLAPGIARQHVIVVIAWSLLMALMLLLWVQNCFSDPGWVRPRTILPQHRLIGEDPTRAFDADQPVESQMVHYDSLTEDLFADPETAELARLELEQNKYNYQRQLITEARKRIHESGLLHLGYPSAGTGGTELQPWMNPADAQQLGISNLPLSPQGQEVQLERALHALDKQECLTGSNVGRVRVETLLRHGCGDYLTLLEKGDFKQVCVVCRARRELRSHHCKECGRCVQRLDHHCPWIDNCVGLGNQRSFYCFIILLFAAIVFFYYVVALYCMDVLFPLWATGFFQGFHHGGSWIRPALGPLLMGTVAAFDLIWIAFVGALVARHTAYMSVNITTYEVLVRPAHVQRRFPKNRGRFWFLSDFGISDCLQNCTNYWTLHTDDDVAAFQGFAPDESFVPSPDKEMSANQVAPQPPAHMQQARYQLVPQQMQYGGPAHYPPTAGQPRGGWP